MVAGTGGLKKIQKLYNRQIAAVAKQHPDFVIFSSFPGAGPAIAPRLLEQRKRHGSARELRCATSSAPWSAGAANSGGSY